MVCMSIGNLYHLYWISKIIIIVESDDLILEVINGRSYIDGVWIAFPENIQEDVLTV